MQLQFDKTVYVASVMLVAAVCSKPWEGNTVRAAVSLAANTPVHHAGAMKSVQRSQQGDDHLQQPAGELKPANTADLCATLCVRGSIAAGQASASASCHAECLLAVLLQGASSLNACHCCHCRSRQRICS